MQCECPSIQPTVYSLTYVDVIQQARNYDCACLQIIYLPSGNSGFRFESIQHERVSEAAGKENNTKGFNVSMYNIFVLSTLMMISVHKTCLILFTWK
jgi:hypothetical protein